MTMMDTRDDAACSALLASCDAGWTATSRALPREGTQVEFLIDTRSCECALAGTYIDGAFVSHWARYESGVVREWRMRLPPQDEHSGGLPVTSTSEETAGRIVARSGSPENA